MSLTELDEKILAEGRKLRATAHIGALKARQSQHLADLEQIATELKELEKVLAGPEAPAPAPAPAEPEATIDEPVEAEKAAPAPAPKSSAKKDEAADSDTAS